METWFTSDTHFRHTNIVELSKRPFQSLEEMTERIIENWNAVIGKSDTVYHLGDFALSWGKKDAEPVDSILARLNGQKHLIVGNHDRDEVVKNKRWASARSYHELKIDMGGVHRQRIVLFHYPIRSWNQIHRGAWMLHGHSHGSLEDIGGKTIDVGVDPLNYMPINIHQVAEIMEKRPPVYYDHHRED